MMGPNAVDKAFQLEALKWTLDCDTIQNFLIDVVPDFNMNAETAINHLKTMAGAGLIRFFESDNGVNNGKFIDSNEINIQYVESHKYTDMILTKKTLSAIGDLQNN